MSSNLHLVSFSSRGYESPDTFLNQAERSGFFRSITIFSDEDIKELMRRHFFHFLIWRKKGFGFWIWKPEVVSKALNKLPEGDFLIYLDQDFHIQSSGKSTLENYINRMNHEQSWVGVFSAGEMYRAECFVKRRAVREYLPEFYSMEFGSYVYGGILIIRNCELARLAVRDWGRLCERSPVTDPLPLRFGEHPAFIGQDGDNGFLPLVLSKHGGYTKFGDDEVTDLNFEGLQLRHVLPSSIFGQEMLYSYRNSLGDRPFLL